MLDPITVNIPLAEQRPAQRDDLLPVRRLLKPSPDNADDYIMEIDYSKASQYLECPRKFENYAIRCREADADATALTTGGLFHKLEETRLRANGEPVTDVQRSMIEAHYIKYPPPAADHRTADRMHQIVKLYTERYKDDHWEKKVYRDAEGPFIERPFKIEFATIELNQFVPWPKSLVVYGDWPEGNDFFISKIHVIYYGRVDLLLEEPPLLWVVDRKTTSRGGRQFEEAFRLSLQTRGYAWAAQKIAGREVAGALLDAVVIRPLTKTGTGTELNRVTYFYSSDSIAEWEDDMKAHVSDMIHSFSRGFFPQSARSFISPCAYCSYQENCALPRSQRAADLASDLYRDVKWDPMHDL